MNALAVVFTGELLRRMRSRAYVAGTVIGTISVVLLALLPGLFGAAEGGGARRVVVAGEPGLVAAARPLLARSFDVVATVDRLPAAPDTAYLDAHRKAGAAIALARAGDRVRAVVYARDPSRYLAPLRRDLGPLQLALATRIPVDEVERRLAVEVTVHDVAGRFTRASDALAARGFAFFFVMLLYLGILLNAQSVMASVAEEKTSRIAELLVAAIDPAQLLAGKVLAAAATGALQLAAWGATGAIAGAIFSGGWHPESALGGIEAGPSLPPAGDLTALAAFFVIGFFQYAVLYAAGGSLINRPEDLGSVTVPLVVPVVIGVVVAQLGIESPQLPGIVLCSQLPLLAPFVMFARIAVTTVPAWQIALSLAINVAAAVGLALLAGRVYRVGLLLYGRAPSFRQLVAALRG